MAQQFNDVVDDLRKKTTRKYRARVITNRCYAVKSSDTLWNRLIPDLNPASEAVGRTIAELREITSGLKAVFLAFCT